MSPSSSKQMYQGSGISGTLTHVLHAQALDAREDAKRRLIEHAGRKEIVVLLPRQIAKTYLTTSFA